MSYGAKLPSIESLMDTLKDPNSSSCQRALEHLVYLYIRHAGDDAHRASMHSALKEALSDRDTFMRVLEAAARLLNKWFQVRRNGDRDKTMAIDRDARWSWMCDALRKRYATWKREKSPNPLYESALKLIADPDAAAIAINALTIVRDWTILPQLEEKRPTFDVPIGAPDIQTIFAQWPFHDLRRAIDYMSSAAQGDGRVETDSVRCLQCGQVEATLSVPNASAYDERLAFSPVSKPRWVDWIDRWEPVLFSTANIVVTVIVGAVLTIVLALSGIRFAYFVWIAMGAYLLSIFLASYFSTRFHGQTFGAELEARQEWSKFYYCGRCDGVFVPHQGPLMSPGEMHSLLRDVQRNFKPAKREPGPVADVYDIEKHRQRTDRSLLKKLGGTFGIVLAIVGIIEAIGLTFDILPRQAPTLTLTQDQIRRAGTEPSYQSYMWAVTNCLTGDYDKAIEQLTETIELEPTFAEAYYYRGLVYLHLGRLERGVADLETVVELAPDPGLRRDAKKELLLTKMADVLVPVHFVSLLGIVILTLIGEKARRFTVVLILDVLVYLFTAVFFLLH